MPDAGWDGLTWRWGTLGVVNDFGDFRYTMPHLVRLQYHPDFGPDSAYRTLCGRGPKDAHEQGYVFRPLEPDDPQLRCSVCMAERADAGH